MARAELPELTLSEADARQRARVRMASMAVALALVVAAAIILTRGHPPARSTAAFCSHIQRSADLSKVLASGNRDQIIAAVHELRTAAEAAV